METGSGKHDIIAAIVKNDVNENVSMAHWGAFRHLTRVVVRYRLHDLLPAQHRAKATSILKCLHPFDSFIYRKHIFAPGHLTSALESLGPLYIKLGQLLSTRGDILPPEVLEELSSLQEHVSPFSSDDASCIVDSLFGEHIKYFDPDCLASGSVAQVHAVERVDGQAAVVKILRPGVKKEAFQNCDTLLRLATWLEYFFSDFRRLKCVEMIQEVKYSLGEELDLRKEAANASLLGRHFQGSDLMRVPNVHWDACEKDALMMGRVQGCCSVANLETLNAHAINLRVLAEKSVMLFYTQVFRDGFFHADMHPGNVYVDLTSPDNPQFVLLDFGIMGTLCREDQYYLACNFLAFFKRDYRRVAELHIDSGWVSPDTRVERLESAVRSVCEPIFERPLKDISFGHTLLTLFQTARDFDMNIQPQLLLLQKTLVNIEGLSRTLYPELDLWQTARPFLEKWMRDQVGVRGLLRRLRVQGPFMSEYLPQLPRLVMERLIEKETPQPEAPKHTWKVVPFAMLAGAVVGFFLKYSIF